MPVSVLTAGGSGKVILTSSTVGLLLDPPNAGLRLDLGPKGFAETVLTVGARKAVEMKTRASNSDDSGPIAVFSSTLTGSCGCVALFGLPEGRRSIS